MLIEKGGIPPPYVFFILVLCFALYIYGGQAQAIRRRRDRCYDCIRRVLIHDRSLDRLALGTVERLADNGQRLTGFECEWRFVDLTGEDIQRLACYLFECFGCVVRLWPGETVYFRRAVEAERCVDVFYCVVEQPRDCGGCDSFFKGGEDARVVRLAHAQNIILFLGACQIGALPLPLVFYSSSNGSA